MADVPCNGCTACCHGPIVLQPAHGDDPSQYETVSDSAWGVKLAQKPDGSCHYLVPGGCSIWNRRPAVCRAFDCRTYAHGWGRIDPLRDEAVIRRGLMLSRPNSDPSRR